MGGRTVESRDCAENGTDNPLEGWFLERTGFLYYSSYRSGERTVGWTASERRTSSDDESKDAIHKTKPFTWRTIDIINMWREVSQLMIDWSKQVHL